MAIPGLLIDWICLSLKHHFQVRKFQCLCRKEYIGRLLDQSVLLLTLQMGTVWIADCILNEELHPSTEIVLISVQIWIFL